MGNKSKIEKVAYIRKIMTAKRYGDLYALVTRISKWNIDYVPIREMTKDEHIAWMMAINHLDFLSKYGDSIFSIEVDGKVWFANHVGFERWLEIDAPGIESDELISYLGGAGESVSK